MVLWVPVFCRIDFLNWLMMRPEEPVVPAAVLAQSWRGSARQHHVTRLLATDAVRVDVLDENTARTSGTILGRSGASDSDVVDGPVPLLGRRTCGKVYTSNEEDIRRIDPTLDTTRSPAPPSPRS